VESQKIEFTEAKRRMVVTRNWGQGDGEMLVEEHKISVRQEEESPVICCTEWWSS
jgi:hypothetical protein